MVTDEIEIQRIEEDRKILLEKEKGRKYDNSAPQVVRDCCDFYDQTYGCTIKDTCEGLNCEYFSRMAELLEEELELKKAKRKKTPKTRYCECGIILEKGKRFCAKCRAKRKKKAAQRAYLKAKMGA